MLELALVLAGLAALALAASRGRGRAFAPPETTPVSPRAIAAFEARPSLFVNSSEAAMFAALDRACPRGLRVFAKVRLEDIVGVRSGVTGEARWKLRSRVKSRHVDFLVVDLGGRPRVAVELDGASHGRGARLGTRNADDLKDALFTATGIPLVRVRVGEDFAAAARGIFRDAVVA